MTWRGARTAPLAAAPAASPGALPPTHPIALRARPQTPDGLKGPAARHRTPAGRNPRTGPTTRYGTLPPTHPIALRARPQTPDGLKGSAARHHTSRHPPHNRDTRTDPGCCGALRARPQTPDGLEGPAARRRDSDARPVYRGCTDGRARERRPRSREVGAIACSRGSTGGRVGCIPPRQRRGHGRRTASRQARAPGVTAGAARVGGWEASRRASGGDMDDGPQAARPGLPVSPPGPHGWAGGRGRAAGARPGGSVEGARARVRRGRPARKPLGRNRQPADILLTLTGASAPTS
ncbi:hypothetical protein GCM10018785_73970 [Streptomyces longispororuber]|uniref:Uncharacterized protein n=1 Tax=Streptomyces longispororuber TaxID=68230 RepID=A0A919ADQ2_9ACTN|nr:hypothetical protein GCM10018785_73970 [Streptomyces longispororuber]